MRKFKIRRDQRVRSRLLTVILVLGVAAFGAGSAWAGPATPTPPTATPATATPATATPATATPATPPPVPGCTDTWDMSTIMTIGKGRSPSNNPKVSHAISGNIVDPTSYGPTAHRIKVCAGTTVTVVVSDTTGQAINTAGGSLTCDLSGCSGQVNSTEKYKSVSSDGKDTDRMTLLPQ